MSRADVTDKKWWQHYSNVLHTQYLQDQIERSKLYHLVDTCVLLIASNARQQVFESIDNRLQAISNRLFPYETADGGLTSQLAAWRSKYGRPGDPKYEAMLAHNDAVFAKIAADRRKKHRATQ